MFEISPTPSYLHWLVDGKLDSRLHRAVRLWVLQKRLYGEGNEKLALGDSFGYADLRKELFAATHGAEEKLGIQVLSASCHDCICRKTVHQILFSKDSQLDENKWCEEVQEKSGLSKDEVKNQLEQRPFATVHRSIREDLSLLAKKKKLKIVGRGKFQLTTIEQSTEYLSEKLYPTIPEKYRWVVGQALNAVSFLQPDILSVIDELQISTGERNSEQRIFLEVDFVLNDEARERIDGYLDQLTRLWQQTEAQALSFEYAVNATEEVPIVIYPVCVHYVRRAIYLSAMGFDPMGKFRWHNYRLDRIVSQQLKVIAWDDSRIPQELQDLKKLRKLPKPSDVRYALDEAWGFNFYLEKVLLILRFPPKFAHWYIEESERHSTFERVQYSELPGLLKKENPKDKMELLERLKHCSSKDYYYKVWVREGDVNLLMRLREWRPNGEVLAPLSLRDLMRKEAKAELEHYGS
jgi:CRISPR-associated protein (TIGR03985 family)